MSKAVFNPAPSPRLPASIPVIRQLESRGVSLARDPEESSDLFEARVETALMALFRDTRGAAEFEVLYAYSSPRLLSWIQILCQRSRASIDPLEFLQDTFVNIYRYAAGFKEDRVTNFQAWSRRIAHNLIRRPRATSERGRTQALSLLVEEPTDRHEDPPHEVIAREDERTLQHSWLIFLGEYASAWKTLSKRDQLALELIEVDELSYVEAARELGVGLSNMKMIVFRARRRIRARMQVRLRAADRFTRRAAV